jgi:hypothetical protein
MAKASLSKRSGRLTAEAAQAKVIMAMMDFILQETLGLTRLEKRALYVEL